MHPHHCHPSSILPPFFYYIYIYITPHFKKNPFPPLHPQHTYSPHTSNKEDIVSPTYSYYLHLFLISPFTFDFPFFLSFSFYYNNQVDCTLFFLLFLLFFSFLYILFRLFIFFLPFSSLLSYSNKLVQSVSPMVQSLDLPVLSFTIPNICQSNDITAENIASMWSGM